MAHDAAESKHTPLRRCRVCRRQLSQSELQRWTLIDGQLVADKPGDRATGRGYYSCSDRCAEILPKTLRKKG